MARSHFAPVLSLLLLGALAAAPAPARASDSCDDLDPARSFSFEFGDDASRGVSLDETRTIPLAAPRGEWRIDGAQNGAISISSWDKEGVLVCAKVVVKATDRAAAAALLRDVRVVADPNGLRVDGPRQGGGRHWAVAVHVFAPRRMSVSAETVNGPITVVGMRGRTRLSSENGPISVTDAGGDVRGGTANGPIELRLTGASWVGDGVDLHTTNGPVTILVPRGYSAELDAGTMNGPFQVAFPVTVQGRLRRTVRTTLGSGGPLIRVRSVNGPVEIGRAR